MSAEITVRSAEPSFLRDIARGVPGAPQACIDRYGGLVWSLARRFSSSDSDAEDAVQDIFLDIWKSAERFDPSLASETTFVATIARRRLIDRRRRDSRRLTTAPLSVSGAEFTDAPIASADDLAEMGEDVVAARQAIEDLSPEQRLVLQLSIFQGLSHDRIARATSLPLGTVKTHARRGLMRVRELIQQSRASRPGAAERGMRP